MSVYHLNKGINKPIEFKGLKAQYIGYLAAGLVGLLLLFAILYLLGLPVYACLTIIAGGGSLLFQQVYRLSHQYGEHGLMKKRARGYLPGYLKFKSRTLFTSLIKQP